MNEQGSPPEPPSQGEFRTFRLERAYQQAPPLHPVWQLCLVADKGGRVWWQPVATLVLEESVATLLRDALAFHRLHGGGYANDLRRAGLEAER